VSCRACPIHRVVREGWVPASAGHTVIQAIGIISKLVINGSIKKHRELSPKCRLKKLPNAWKKYRLASGNRPIE